MPLDPDRVDTVVLDSFSTLVDVGSTRTALEPFVDDPSAVSRVWELRTREYAVVGNAVGVYRPSTERHRLALDYALDVHDEEVSQTEREEILDVYHQLEPFDDVPMAVKRIHDGGHDVHVLSNGDPSLLDSLLETTGTEDLIQETVSADEIHAYKPARALYEHAADRAGTQPGNCLLVSASWSDINGGIVAGFQTIWLNRKRRDWEPYARHPDAIVDDLFAVAELLAT